MSADHRPSRPWGRILADGSFREIPWEPLVQGNYGPPPFDVRKPDGTVIHIVEKPEDGV